MKIDIRFTYRKKININIIDILYLQPAIHSVNLVVYLAGDSARVAPRTMPNHCLIRTNPTNKK